MICTDGIDIVLYIWITVLYILQKAVSSVVLSRPLCCCASAGDEGSGSASGSGCKEACVTEFDFVSTEAPVVGADRSGPIDDSATLPAPSLVLSATLTLAALALHRLWR